MDQGSCCLLCFCMVWESQAYRQHRNQLVNGSQIDLTLCIISDMDHMISSSGISWGIDFILQAMIWLLVDVFYYLMKFQELLLFVGDGIIFCRATTQEANKIREILLMYQSAPGLLINLDKSELSLG